MEDSNKNQAEKKVRTKKKGSKIFIIIIISILVILLFYIIYLLSEINIFDNHSCDKKPVIYLYPEEKTDVSVSLDFDGKLTCTYPEYNNGWNVTAYPDGKIINKDGKEYSYLYWEGKSNTKFDMSQGFVVKGKDTEKFLQEKLSYMGLTSKEYNEFIVYWLPQMQNNKYNLITFQDKAYTDSAKLNISPKPDSMLRIFMVFKPLKKPVEIPEQNLKTFERKGFSVIEWGGSEIK